MMKPGPKGNDPAQNLKYLQESQTRYELITSGARDGFWDWIDLAGDELWLSPSFCHMLGYESGELVIRASEFGDFVHPEDRAARLEAIRDHFEKRIPYDTQFRIRCKSGNYLWVRSRGQARWNEAGRPVRFAGSLRNIDGRKKALARLKLSQEVLTTAQELAHIGHWTWDIDADEIEWSDEFSRILGLGRGDVVPSHEAFLARIHPDDLQMEKAAREEALAAPGNIYKLQHRILCPDGSVRYVLSQGKVTSWTGEGRPGFMVGYTQDITEEIELRQKAEYRLQQIIQADKLASLGTVVAGVAHEINNPNSFITYNTPILQETWEIFKPMVEEYARAHPGWRREGMTIAELCQDMDEIIQAILTGSDRINRVVTNLKDFARLDTSSHSRLIDVNEAIEKTFTIVGAQARKHIGTITLSLGEDMPRIQGHLQKLEQVIANLVVNAAKAIPVSEEGRLTISSRYVSRLQAVIVEVEDNGRGMDARTMEQIFNPFFTTRRDDGGTGLGLSVSYGLVQEHNGVIGVLSRPGLGSRFTLVLPVDRREARFNLSPMVLGVDDDPGFLKLFQFSVMRMENLSPRTTRDPRTVISFLLDHPEVIMVFSDVIMPEMNGYELLERIRERFPLLPVVLFSGDPQALDCTERKSRPDFLLEKPFGKSKLLEIVDSLRGQSVWLS